MPRGRRRKIEVPTDTPPQFELGDTAEDIERMKREREERDERERIEQEERDRERETERREESQERGEKRVRTDTDTDLESTQSRQKKGQMKSIFLSDSDKEAIVEFVKQHEELYDKTNGSFKDKQKKEGLWEQLAATRKLPVKTVKEWFNTQHTRYGKLTQTKSGQAAENSIECQTWLKDSFSFLRGHIRRKGVSKSSSFKSLQRPSAATASASVPDTSRDTESEMEISIASDVTHQPSSTSPKRRQPPVATTTTSADPVLDQFQQMRSMISTFLGARQDPTPSPRQLFCNYLHSEVENLEERDFLTFRNESVKLLSEIQYKAEERKTGHHKSRGHHITTSRSITVHSRTGICTHHPGNSTSLNSSCAASTDYHRTACYSDCESTATIGAFIIVSTAYFLCSCG